MMVQKEKFKTFTFRESQFTASSAIKMARKCAMHFALTTCWLSHFILFSDSYSDEAYCKEEEAGCMRMGKLKGPGLFFLWHDTIWFPPFEFEWEHSWVHHIRYLCYTVVSKILDSIPNCKKSTSQCNLSIVINAGFFFADAWDCACADSAARSRMHESRSRDVSV